MDPGHKAKKDPSDNADLDFQAVGPALCINVKRLSAAKCCIIFTHTRKKEFNYQLVDEVEM